MGLRIQVWNNRGNSISCETDLHPGKIHSINFEQSKKCCFQLQLDDADESESYPMVYDVALVYADECRTSFTDFRLPPYLLSNPVNESDTSTENCKREYVSTNLESWTVSNNAEAGRTIQPNSFTGESKESSVKRRDKELTGVKDHNGDIWFSKVKEVCLPCFDQDSVYNGVTRPPLDFWEWQAVQMGNYMLYLIDHHRFKPKYYCRRDPANPICILSHHVCHLNMANMLVCSTK